MHTLAQICFSHCVRVRGSTIVNCSMNVSTEVVICCSRPIVQLINGYNVNAMVNAAAALQSMCENNIHSQVAFIEHKAQRALNKLLKVLEKVLLDPIFMILKCEFFTHFGTCFLKLHDVSTSQLEALVTRPRLLVERSKRREVSRNTIQSE